MPGNRPGRGKIMLQIRRSNERGHANHGWLDTYHTFSFNTYYDPRFMGFRALRVINEDKITGGAGFGTHPHNDMEIVTYVLEGALAHKDSIGAGGAGNSGVIQPGELQHMSAGSGIRHSEFNASQTDSAHLLQIWVQPSQKGIPPSYGQKSFPIAEEPDALHLLASPDGSNGSLKWVTDAELYGGRLSAGTTVEHNFTTRKYGWLQVARGAATVNGATLNQGDGLALSDEAAAKITAGPEGAEVLLFDLA
jgi:redox-sensitive bicupin YhaK (pirin superfamily)